MRRGIDKNCSAVTPQVAGVSNPKIRNENISNRYYHFCLTKSFCPCIDWFTGSPHPSDWLATLGHPPRLLAPFIRCALLYLVSLLFPSIVLKHQHGSHCYHCLLNCTTLTAYYIVFSIAYPDACRHNLPERFSTRFLHKMVVGLITL